MLNHYFHLSFFNIFFAKTLRAWFAIFIFLFTLSRLFPPSSNDTFISFLSFSICSLPYNSLIPRISGDNFARTLPTNPSVLITQSFVLSLLPNSFFHLFHHHFFSPWSNLLLFRFTFAPIRISTATSSILQLFSRRSPRNSVICAPQCTSSPSFQFTQTFLFDQSFAKCNLSHSISFVCNFFCRKSLTSKMASFQFGAGFELGKRIINKSFCFYPKLPDSWVSSFDIQITMIRSYQSVVACR